MSPYPHQQEIDRAQSEFFDRVSDAVFTAGMSDGGLEVPSLVSIIEALAMAREEIDKQQNLLNATHNAVVGAGSAGQVSLNDVSLSDEEYELEILKMAVMNPPLYNNIRDVFVQHKYPEKLDPVGKRLREFFINQKG